jgi:hypothetical protein
MNNHFLERAPFHRRPKAAAILVLVALASLTKPASAEDAALRGTFEAVRAIDAQMARIGYRLATANASLCDRLEPGLGIVLHTPSQYAGGLRKEAAAHFRFAGPVAVEAVIEGSPAAQAGIEADDTLIAIGPAQFAPADPQAKTSTAALIKAAAQVAALPPDRPLEIHGVRDGVAYTRTVTPVSACRTRFEAAIKSDFEAQADGEMVQLSSRFLLDYPEDQVAAAMAHELAHNVLRHGERLEAQGVSYGLLAGLGRNVRYFRQTEIEADILSVSLLANAGYDPNAAVRFWRDFGPKHAGGILLSRSHPAWRDRLATIERTISALEAARPAGRSLVQTRSQPLSGEWQALLVEAK